MKNYTINKQPTINKSHFRGFIIWSWTRVVVMFKLYNIMTYDRLKIKYTIDNNI